MNWDQVGGMWKQTQGKFREKWGKLTDDDLEVIAGKRDQLIGLYEGSISRSAALGREGACVGYRPYCPFAP